jgi:hypothetical protein
MDKQYKVGSSHGKLTTDADGYVTDRDLDNDEPDGGAHLARIVRIDIVEWRRFWNNPDTRVIDILDLGYWRADPKTHENIYAPPDAEWRAEIAQKLFARIPAVVNGAAS